MRAGRTPEGDGKWKCRSRRKIARSFLLFRRKVPPCWLDDNESRRVRKRTGVPVDFEQSLRAERPRRVVMTSGVSSRGTFLSSNPLNPRKPSSLIAPDQVSSLSHVPAVARWQTRTPRKNTQLSLCPIVDETAEIHSAACRTSPQFHSSRAFPGIQGDEKSASHRSIIHDVLVAHFSAISQEMWDLRGSREKKFVPRRAVTRSSNFTR